MKDNLPKWTDGTGKVTLYRLREWKLFASEVHKHIKEYTIPQYGDFPNDQITEWTVEDCLKAVRKRLSRFGANARGGQEKLDLLKMAHEVCIAYSKFCADKKERGRDCADAEFRLFVPTVFPKLGLDDEPGECRDRVKMNPMPGQRRMTHTYTIHFVTGIPGQLQPAQANIKAAWYQIEENGALTFYDADSEAVCSYPQGYWSRVDRGTTEISKLVETLATRVRSREDVPTEYRSGDAEILDDLCSAIAAIDQHFSQGGLI
jgi:hypothetical protein